jgi:hypothetical protein
MTIAILTVLALALLAFVIFSKSPNLVLAIMCSGMWVVLLFYDLANPFAGMPASSTGGNIVVVVFMVGIIAPMLITFMRNSNDKKERIAKLRKEGREQGIIYDRNGKIKPQYNYEAGEYEARTDAIYGVRNRRNRR